VFHVVVARARGARPLPRGARPVPPPAASKCPARSLSGALGPDTSAGCPGPQAKATDVPALASQPLKRMKCLKFGVVFAGRSQTRARRAARATARISRAARTFHGRGILGRRIPRILLSGPVSTVAVEHPRGAGRVDELCLLGRSEQRPWLRRRHNGRAQRWPKLRALEPLPRDDNPPST